jgi:ribosomal protection tetracycline resistance protein
MESLNLGILAHVDAGKTSLTERLLYEAGAIEHLGSVDRGDTQTDTLAVERARGITVRSAVVSFEIDHVPVNLIDTPGHPDFIAEVERVLRILDAAVVVISAVEGVQPQTRVLMRALGRLELPTLFFVNKIDRDGAREESVLREIRTTLRRVVVPMGSTSALGTKAARFAAWTGDDPIGQERWAETLGIQDESILRDYLEQEGQLPPERFAGSLRAQTRRGVVHPAFFGSARTGAGVDALMSGIADLLPATQAGDPDGPTLGTVFKIERGNAREKIAYARLFSGTVHLRDRLRYGDDHEDRVVALTVPDGRSDPRRRKVTAGTILKIWGLKDVRIGDRIGRSGSDHTDHQFAPPTMETLVRARHPADGARLRAALRELAEQDPLIRIRPEEGTDEVAVSLYGEVQKEIILSALADDYEVATDSRPTTTIYIERPAAVGAAVDLLTSDANPYMATVGLRIEPGRPGSGLRMVLAVDQRSVPLYIYKSEEAFVDHMTGYLRGALGRGLCGWEVTDCVVTLTDCGYYIGDGPTKPTVPMARTTSADFRALTPRVLARAVEKAGTRVCGPMLRVRIESPGRTVGGLLQALSQLGGTVGESRIHEGLSSVDARMPADGVRELQRRLPGLSGGEATFESRFDGYEPVGGRIPRRVPVSGETA